MTARAIARRARRGQQHASFKVSGVFCLKLMPLHLFEFLVFVENFENLMNFD